MQALTTIAAAAALLAACLVPSSARAEPRCDTSRPWVLVRPSPPLTAGVDRASVVDRLRTELSERGMSLCTSPPPGAGPPLIADVALTPVAGAKGAAVDGVSLDIEVRDEVTSKRVGRVVDLSGVPSDGRAVIVALAVAELLRASWAELALAGARPAKRDVPPEVRATIAPARSEPSALDLGVRGAAEWWSGGLPLLGGDGLLVWLPARRFATDLLVGARIAPDATSASGHVSLAAFTLRVGAAVGLTRPEARTSMFVGARTGAYVLRLSGEAGAESNGASTTAVAVSVEAGPRMSIRLGARLHLSVDAALGVAIRGVEARDGGASVTGLTGVGGLLGLGILAGGGG